jgi:hypothetical protein
MQVKQPYVLDIPAGKSITYACQLAVKVACEKKNQVHFKFNGVEMDVFPGDDQDTAYQFYQEQQTLPESQKISRAAHLDPFDL